MYYEQRQTDNSADPDPFEILDCISLQNLFDDLHAITGYSMAIIDNAGKVLVKTRWQDICEAFHRKNDDCRKKCMDSDINPVKDTPPGEFRLYQCPNKLWDVVTPLWVQNRHIANLFFGQFLFLENEPDQEVFIAQARTYGFDQTEYLRALEAVPRYSHDQVARIMTFISRFANMISSLNHNRLQADVSLRACEELASNLGLHSMVLDQIYEGVLIVDLNGIITYINSAACKTLGRSSDEVIGKHRSFLMLEPVSGVDQQEMVKHIKLDGFGESILILHTSDGEKRNLKTRGEEIEGESGECIAFCATSHEITP